MKNYDPLVCPHKSFLRYETGKQMFFFLFFPIFLSLFEFMVTFIKFHSFPDDILLIAKFLSFSQFELKVYLLCLSAIKIMYNFLKKSTTKLKFEKKNKIK